MGRIGYRVLSEPRALTGRGNLFNVAVPMKVTFNWLRQYVDFDWSPEELTERLTLLGLEAENVHKIGGEFEGIVIAQILTKDKVPG